MSNATVDILGRVRAKFPRALLADHAHRGDLTIILERDALLGVARFLKEDPDLSFEMLMDLTVVDHLHTLAPPEGLRLETPSGGSLAVDRHVLDRPDLTKLPEMGLPTRDRFQLVVHLYSLSKNHRLRLKVPLPETDPSVESLTPVWPGADWFEREAYDFYGVVFRGHPGLKRIFLYPEFQGHPLRKDYPVDRRQPLVAEHDPRRPGGGGAEGEER